MNTKPRHRETKSAAWILIAALSILAVSCTSPFPTPFENIVADQKLRPFAVVCNPPEAAPGDTVNVSLYYYAPPAESPSIHWLVSLDYGLEPTTGSEYEKNVVSLDNMMLQPGSTPTSFSFRVPDDVLVNSSQIGLLLTNPNLSPYLNPFNWSARTINDTLKFAATAGITDSLLWPAADNFSTTLRLRAEMRSSISVDVIMPLRVRYTNRIHPANANKNPVIHWMGIIRVPVEGFGETDSVYDYPHEMLYLYNPAHPDSVRDTIVIDSGYSYFIAADSGIYGADTQFQKYNAYSTNNLSRTLDTESFGYTWFYTNLDYNSGMVMDSLLLLGEGHHAVGRMYPPVDPAMHRFQVYLVLRDRRCAAFGATTGEAFVTKTGYFSYTEAYKRHAVRHGGGGIFGG
jgi:hypothetical protein